MLAMHHLPKIFDLRKHSKRMDQTPSPKPKLDRRNALKNFDYNPSALESPSCGSSGYRSLVLPHDIDKSSFRIDSSSGEMVGTILQRIGIGVEDLGISMEAFETMIRSSADIVVKPRTSHFDYDDEPNEVVEEAKQIVVDDENDGVVNLAGESKYGKNELRVNPNGIGDFLLNGKYECPVVKSGGIKGDRPPAMSDMILRLKKSHFDYDDEPNEVSEEDEQVVVGTISHRDEENGVVNLGSESSYGKNELMVYPNGIGDSLLNGKYECTIVKSGGIKGDRPPLLTPPPPVSLPVLDDRCSTWELCHGFGPDNGGSRRHFYCNLSFKFDDEKGDGVHSEGFNGVVMGETSSVFSSFATTNDDDSSSTTTEPVSINSPQSNIFLWEKGALLGRGSFGSVYEGISSEGFFFAVKEVSLLEQGSQGKQSIYQLEQEIQLLSQFQHENIVRYLGTDKDDSNLYIFLELVTQGSLASLYHKYRLRDSHASKYTRQILMGLKYLHDQNVVHRDIKCSNTLVTKDGIVKLADFGLAKATRLNDLKSCKGTVFWMAPEVFHRKNQGYGLPADIWSLGCTVLEMLTGHVPYHPLEVTQAMFKIAKGEPPPIPDSLSREARDFIQKCICVNPDDRPSATELLEHPFLRRPLIAPPGSESPMLLDR